jgi:hypothetical protein
MEWGIDETISNPGGLQSQQDVAAHEKDSNRREVYLLQRRSGKLGAGLGKTTGELVAMLVVFLSDPFSVLYCVLCP